MVALIVADCVAAVARDWLVQVDSSCGAFQGKSYCGAVPPRIGQLECGTGKASGACVCVSRECGSCHAAPQEKSLADCKYDDDVFCAANENAVIQCAGDGDTQGRP